VTYIRRVRSALLLFPVALAAQTPRRPIADLPIRARVAVPASADWMALGYGAVWVVNYKPDRVSRIDPTTARVTAEIPLASKACLGIVVAMDRVWIPTCGDGAMTAIDPTTNRIVAHWPLPIALGREGSFAFSDGSFWIPANVPDSTSPEIARVNARSGQIERRIRVSARSDVVVSAFGALWVASSATDTVLRIDPATNAVSARIAVGPSPKFMTAGSGALWVQNRRDGSVSRVDPVTNREAARIESHAPTEWGDIAAGEDAIWLSADGTPVTRIDPQTNRVSDQFVGGSGVDAIRVGYGAIWLADHEHGEVWQVDVQRLITGRR
jgi:YVTN family beta-propeller protein